MNATVTAAYTALGQGQDTVRNVRKRGLFGNAFEKKVDFEWQVPREVFATKPVLLCGVSYAFEQQWGYLTYL